jgi:hypothetical protein
MAVAVSVLEAGAGRQGKANLMRFRRGWYGCLSRRADALFELTDALLAAGRVISLPYPSLDGLHRRGHGSTYAALANGRVGAEAARALFADSLPRASCPVFAVDVSMWVRSDAEYSPGRGYYYPSRHLAGQPIVAGWADAAALPASAEAAVGVLRQLGLTPGETLLILGGGGSVGLIATQLALSQGATVISATGPRDEELGAIRMSWTPATVSASGTGRTSPADVSG